MKKLVFLAVLTFILGSTLAQSAVVPSVTFTSNPNRFNDKMVTVTDAGMVRSNDRATYTRCHIPAGFEKVNVMFKSDPDFEGCFFMQRRLANAVTNRLRPHGSTPVQITFKGSKRTGYIITLFRLAR